MITNYLSTTILKPVYALTLALGFSTLVFAEPNSLVKVQSSESDYRVGIAGIAQNYLGIPYILGARGPRAFDCSGFTSYVFNEFGANLYPLASSQADFGEFTSLQDVRPSDLIFFGRGKNITHVAMVIRRSEEGVFVVHCTSSRGVIVENITQSHYWSPKIVGARNVVNKLFEFVPSSGLFSSIAAPIITKMEQTMQASVQNFNAFSEKMTQSAAAAILHPEERSVYEYSKAYSAPSEGEISSFSRTYGNSSKDDDDADADNDDNGQP
ncbi:MAG: hypothetical protein RI894_1719 [Bacteroidota bacterium]